MPNKVPTRHDFPRVFATRLEISEAQTLDLIAMVMVSSAFYEIACQAYQDLHLEKSPN